MLSSAHLQGYHPFENVALLSMDFSKSRFYQRKCLSQPFLNRSNEERLQVSEQVVFESSSKVEDSSKEKLKKFVEDSVVPDESRLIELKTTKFMEGETVLQEMELAEEGELIETDMTIAETGDEDAEFNTKPCENKVFAAEEKQSLSVSFMVNSGLSQQQRAKPRNPRLEIENSTLEDVARKLEDRTMQKMEVARSDSLFTADEKAMFKKSRPDLSKINSEKWPLLHILVASGQEFYLDKFLKQGADVNVIDKDGYSAVQRAVLAKKTTAVNLLLGAGADVAVRDKAGASLLHYSVQTGSMNLVRLFVDRGVDVNSADKYGWTPLHLAVLSGRADIVKLLIVSGADETLSNKDGCTPFDLSLNLGRGFNSCEVAKVLKKLPKTQALRFE